jgi:predicted dienelactone hydrolase
MLQSIYLRATRRAHRAALVLLALFSLTPAAFSLSPPPPPTRTPPALVGEFPVGCSNVEQDVTRLASGETVVDYWEGNPRDNGNRYVTDLLVAPAKALTYSVAVPSRASAPELGSLFGRTAGTPVPYAAIFCYPTTTSNTRANYPLPAGRVPRMERDNDAPLIAANPRSADGKWPLIVLSHGLAGSPLGNEYLQVIERFAAEGYLVYAPFHADARFSRTKIEDLSDAVYVLRNYDEIAEMQALRPLGLKQGLDYLLTRVEYANAIDQDRIVGFGASLGGMAMTLLQGAKISTSLSNNNAVTIVRDTRYKAVVGYVPFAGYSFQAAFGESNSGTKGIRVPFLGLGGTADVVAPVSRSLQAIDNMSGARYFVTIEGMPHGLRAEDAPELFGWTFAFYRAYLAKGGGFRDLDSIFFNTIANFSSPADDRVQLRKPTSWSYRDELEVVQYSSRVSNKFFMTGNPAEIALLDSYPALWQRTGHRFATFRLDSTLGSPMCRFWAYDGAKINTHFYSIVPSDCDLVRAQPWARDEGFVMRAQPLASPSGVSTAATATCPADMVKVHRLFNINSINHMYITESLLARSIFTADWTFDGAVFCAGEYE